MTRLQAMAYRRIIEKAAESLTDDYAYEVPEIFKRWESAQNYVVGDRRSHKEKLYKCVQAHTSQPDWEPDVTPALWVEVAKPGEIPVWKQPTGAQDAYMTGDKVHYPTKDDPVYISTVDNNVWVPGVYGWDLVE